jgi:hypothetical protein
LLLLLPVEQEEKISAVVTPKIKGKRSKR